jgi:DNA polymerase-3 subunit epsilon
MSVYGSKVYQNNENVAKEPKNLIYIDVETNGIGPFRPAQQRVVQLAWIINDTEKSYFISGVTAVSDKVPHPYDVEFLAEHGSDFNMVIQDFYNDLREATHIVAHNASFDIGCILNELRLREESLSSGEIADEIKNKSVFDTMKRTVNICKLDGKYGYKWPRLEELYYFCFQKKPDLILHDALNDCMVTRDCLNMLVKNNMLNLY